MSISFSLGPEDYADLAEAATRAGYPSVDDYAEALAQGALTVHRGAPAAAPPAPAWAEPVRGTERVATTPAEFAAALSASAAGDTITLRSGDYDAFAVGKADLLIRAYPGERARIRNTGGVTCQIGAPGVVLLGLELHDPSAANRPNASGTRHGLLLGSNSGGARFICCVIHDHWGQGWASWKEGPGALMDGCLLYHNGSLSNFDHGVYYENADPAKPKLIDRSIILLSGRYNVHAYSGYDAPPNRLQGLGVKRSALALAGSPTGQIRAEITVGSDYSSQRPGGIVLDGNQFWHPDPAFPTVDIWGPSGTNGALAITNNLTGGDPTIRVVGTFSPKTISGNRAPKAGEVVVTPIPAMPGRAHVVAYGAGATVPVPPAAAGLIAGQPYEVRDAFNWPGAPVLTGTTTAEPIPIPTTSRAVATPTDPGLRAVPHPLPAFGCWVVMPAAR